MIARPSGRHSPAVYWRRRVVLILTVVLIIWGVSRLVTGSDDGGGQAAPAASQSSADPTPEAEPTSAETEPTPAPKKRKKSQRTVNVSLPAADTTCDPGTVRVAPSVAAGTYAGGGVPLQIGFSSTADTPCTLKVTTTSLVVAVADSDDDLWQSGRCNPLDDRTVEVQPTWTTFVEIGWSGRESGKKCGSLGDYLPAGSYEVKVAMLGGEPASSEFTLAKKPEPKPKPKPKAKAKSKADDKASDESG